MKLKKLFYSRLTAILMLFGIVAMTAGAQSINLDVGGTLYSGVGIAPDTGTTWNGIAGTAEGTGEQTISTVLGSDGTILSGVTITIVTDRNPPQFKAYSDDTTAGPNPVALMQDYFYQGNYTVTISGLPEGTYDLYSFPWGNAATQHGDIAVDAANGGATGSIGDGVGNFRDMLASGAEGTVYYKLAVTVDSSGTLVFLQNGYLSGFQLYKAGGIVIDGNGGGDPEPTTLNAMLVVNNADLSSGFDQAINDRLISLGYTVTVETGGNFTDATMTVLNSGAYDVLVVSESIGSANVDELAGGDATIDLTIPMMHNEAYGWDNIGLNVYDPEMDGDNGGVWFPDMSNSLQITGDTHPIISNAGLSNGTLTPYVSLANFLATDRALIGKQTSGWGSGVQTLATGTGAENVLTAIYAIEQGATLVNGTALNRIAGMPFPGPEAGTNRLASDVTDEYWAIFDAMMDWLAPVPSPSRSFSGVSASNDGYIANDTGNGLDRDTPGVTADAIHARYFFDGTSAYRMRVAYVRFDLEDVDPNYIPGSFSDVKLELGRRSGDADGAFKVYGILETFDNVQPSSMTYNTAIGLDLAATPNLNQLPVVDVNQVTTSVLIQLPSSGGTAQTSTTDTTLLSSFLNDDTDGIVTFMITPASDIDLGSTTAVQTGGLITSISGGNNPAANRVEWFGDYPKLSGSVGVTVVNDAKSWTMFE